MIVPHSNHAVIMGNYDKDFNRYRWNSTRQNSLPFLIKIALPHPRKARIITERNILGEIVHSKTPQIQL